MNEEYDRVAAPTMEKVHASTRGWHKTAEILSHMWST